MAARVGGANEGTYLCHLRQMITKKPLNVNDEAVFDGMSHCELPLSHPTRASTPLQRIQLAEICRGMVDRSPLAMAHTGALSHDAIMDIDTELQQLINNVPAFYTMAISALVETFGLTCTQAESFVFQGQTTYFLLYSQRCKLHLPFFGRGLEDPTYCTSREICIKHARLILQSDLLRGQSYIDNAARFRFTGLLTGVFLACIVLLMDVCANPQSPTYENQRKEVQDSFRMIEGAMGASENTSRLVGSLINILQRNNVIPIDVTSRQQKASANYNCIGQGSMNRSGEKCSSGISKDTEQSGSVETIFLDDSQDEFSDNISQLVDETTQLEESSDDLMLYWNDFTQTFDQGMDIDSFDWDTILSDLESSFV
jgi:hypothetical protein